MVTREKANSCLKTAIATSPQESSALRNVLASSCLSFHCQQLHTVGSFSQELVEIKQLFKGSELQNGPEM